jgi:nicotinate-nucleotide adenylyltransferase
MELDAPHRPYSVETLSHLKNELADTEIFFVMGADSWQDITTWREWEKVLTLVNIIVVTRPDYEIGFAHVTDKIRERILDLRKKVPAKAQRREEVESKIQNLKSKIFITNAVQIDISATEIRQKIRENQSDWRRDVPPSVVKYIEKYELYI